MPYKGREEFAMFYIKQMGELITDRENPLSLNERALLFSLIPFLDYEGQVVVPDENGKPERLSVTRVGGLLGWKHRETTGKCLNSLEEKGIITFSGGRPKYIVLNPRFFYRGKADKRPKAIRDFNELTIHGGYMMKRYILYFKRPFEPKGGITGNR